MKIGTLIVTLIIFSAASFSQEKYGSEFSVNLVIPSGSSAEFFNNGFGVNGNFYYDLEKNIRIGISIGYLRITANSEEIRNQYESIVSESGLEASGSIRALPLMLTFKLITPDNPVRVYGALEGGLWTYWTSVSGTFNNSGGAVTIDKSEFRSEAGFAAGMGLLFGLSQELSLDLGIKYQFVQDSEYLNVNRNSIETSRLIMIDAGLNWNFNI
jgi:opacity protein-like surface antigen